MPPRFMDAQSEGRHNWPSARIKGEQVQMHPEKLKILQAVKADVLSDSPTMSAQNALGQLKTHVFLPSKLAGWMGMSTSTIRGTTGTFGSTTMSSVQKLMREVEIPDMSPPERKATLAPAPKSPERISQSAGPSETALGKRKRTEYVQGTICGDTRELAPHQWDVVRTIKSKGQDKPESLTMRDMLNLNETTGIPRYQLAKAFGFSHAKMGQKFSKDFDQPLATTPAVREKIKTALEATHIPSLPPEE